MKQSKYEEIGTRSVNRAAAKVFENALRNNQALPIWIDGKVEHIVPNQKQVDDLIKRTMQLERSKPVS